MADSNSTSDGTRAGPPPGSGPMPKSASTLADSVIPVQIGRFKIQSLLGEGAFGRVYLGFDAELDRQVAIKIPKPEGLSADIRDRFLREARATAKIHHPNVCPVYEVGTEGEVPFMVMYYLAGTTLATHLDKWKVLPPLNAVALVQRLALGMAAAHEKNVIHRDLKPQNILFDPDKQLALITDFGLARIGATSQTTVVGTVFGTPFYMSPEQARGETAAIGPLSDVYSLGIIFYRMLTGDVPFNGSVYEVLLQHCEKPPLPPSHARRGLDVRLDALCMKALAKKPSDRYPSAKAFADALASYLRATDSTGWFGSDETHRPPRAHPVQPPPVSPPRPPLPPDLAKPVQPEPLPLDDEPESGGVRVKVLLAGIAVLFLAIMVIIGVLVATRQRTPQVVLEPPPAPNQPANANTPDPPKLPPVVPPPKPPDPPSPANGFAGHAFDQAAERRAATWVLSMGGAVQVVPKENTGSGSIVKGIGGSRPIKDASELPAAFTVAFIDLRGRPELTDDAFRANLAGLSGPVRIHLHDCTQISDETLKLLARIPKLTGLHLTKAPRATDAGLAALAGHPAIEELTLVSTGVSKAGIQNVAKLPAITQLRIDTEDPDTWLGHLAPLANLSDLTIYARDRAELTALGLIHLKSFRKLNRLALIGRNVTDDWLLPIAAFDTLVELDLVNTRVFGPGLVHLKKLPRLRSITLEDSLVRNEGMPHLAACPSLEEIDLTGTYVGDAGAGELSKATGLRKVVLSRTNVSAMGVRMLESSLPKCRVFGGER